MHNIHPRGCWPTLQRSAAVLFVSIFLLAMGADLSAAPASKRHTVNIEGLQNLPATLEVKAGDTVVWKNKDPFPHNVTAENNAFHSGDIQPGHSWSFKTKQKGIFPYVCTLHSNMKATLIVK